MEYTFLSKIRRTPKSAFLKEHHLSVRQARALLCLEKTLGIREKETYFWKALPYFEREHINILLDLCALSGVHATDREYYTPSSWQTIYVQLWKNYSRDKRFIREFKEKELRRFCGKIKH
jgi:hypothetical protein